MPKIRTHWQPPRSRGEREADPGFAVALARQAGVFFAEPKREGEPYSVRRAGAVIFEADSIPEVVAFLRDQLQEHQT
ncbi:MAG: hypothetical protein KF863_10850 [Rubrivivax sp.]|nr:hypothetical protein [Rubrivivax sp.]